MFRRIKNRIAAMRGVGILLSTAEEAARADGLDRPAAEHMVIAALRHPDGRAAALLAPHGIDADAFATAVREVHAAALETTSDSSTERGLDAALPEPARPRGVYRSSASGQELMQRVAAQSTDFDSAEIVREAADAEHGTVALAFRTLGISKSDLR